MDALENITHEGYLLACSLDSFKSIPLSQILPEHLPEEFLFKVNSTMPLLLAKCDMSNVYDFIRPYIFQDDPYPDADVIRRLALSVKTHVEKIKIFHRMTEINILMLGCEQPAFVVIFYLLLSSPNFLQNRVNRIKITVIEKNPDRCKRGEDLLADIRKSFPEIISQDNVSFQTKNFLQCQNAAIISNCDIVFNFVSSASHLFALKFCMLLFEVNQRPYFQFGKLFLFKRGFLRVLDDGLLEGTICKKRRPEFTHELFCVVKHTSNSYDNKMRNIHFFTSFSNTSDNHAYQLQYYSEFDSNFIVQQNQNLVLLFVTVLENLISKAKLSCWQTLYNTQNNRFFEVLQTSASLCIRINSRIYDSLLIKLGECSLTIDICDICGIAVTPDLSSILQMGKEAQRLKEHRGSTFTTETGLIFILDESTLTVLQTYMETSCNNMLNCLISIQASCSQYASILSQNINESFVDDYSLFLKWFTKYSVENCPSQLKFACSPIVQSAAQMLSQNTTASTFSLNWNYAGVQSDTSMRSSRLSKRKRSNVTSIVNQTQVAPAALLNSAVSNTVTPISFSQIDDTNFCKFDVLEADFSL